MNEPLPFMSSRPSFELAVVQCPKCEHCWVRNVPEHALEGNWLCPQGWSADCPSDAWVRVDRPEVMAAWRLAGLYGFGDMKGFDPSV